MKAINLISIINAYEDLSPDLRNSYFANFNMSPKLKEFNDLIAFVNELLLINQDIEVFDTYFLGYTIPQISKEFDLLRFGKESILNIELKSTYTGEKIIKQLIQNKYYLSFLDKKILNYTFISDEKMLYSINEDQNLIEVKISELLDIISNQEVEKDCIIDSLFNPTNYLVSPFNSTNAFLETKYFLTDHQEEIKLNAIKLIENSTYNFISICGNAGTGKTLLTYDIAKELIRNKKKVLIIHCGLLNDGHIKLRDENDWDIIPIKYWRNRDFSEYFMIIIDEVQRIRRYQLEVIIKYIRANNSKCIFSYDNLQCLTTDEINNNIAQYITDETSAITFKLTEKIRTNKEIASFILALFDKSRPIEKQKTSNVELSYFKKHIAAKKYIEQLSKQGWKIINYTPSTYNKDYPYEKFKIPYEDNAHTVIGQEFDKVVAVIDEYFYYDGIRLTTRGYKNSPYYHPTKMLFQIVTRTRKKLCIVIIDNNELLERSLNILGHSVVENIET